MAKDKDDQLDLDMENIEDFEDLDIDSLFEDDDLDNDTDVEEADGKKRNPIKDSIKKTYKAAVDNVKSKTIQDHASGVLKTALTEDGKSALGEINSALSEIKEETKKALDPLGRSVSSISKSIAGMVPESKLKDMLESLGDKFSGDDHGSYQEQRESLDSFKSDMDSTLESIQERISEQHAEATSTIKTEAQSKLLSKSIITQAVMKEQDRIYYSKSLELQFRIAKAAEANLDLARNQYESYSKLLNNIIHNTSLPEAVKITNTELAGITMKQKAYGSLSETLYKRLSPLSGFKENVIRRIRDRVEEVSDLTEVIADTADMASELRDAGLSKEQMIGNSLSDMVLNKVYKTVSDKFIPKSIKNKVSGHLTGLASNPVEYLKSIRESDPEGLFSKLYNKGVEFTLEDLPSAGTRDIKLNKAALTEQAIFDGRTHNTINTVLPKLLSKIHNEVYGIRTGNKVNENTELRYDVKSGGFKSTGAIKKEVNQNIKKDMVYSAQESSKGLVKLIKDKLANIDTPNKKAIMSSLDKHILTYMADHGSIAPESLTSGEFIRYYPPKYQLEAADLFGEFVRTIRDSGNSGGIYSTFNYASDQLKILPALMQKYATGMDLDIGVSSGLLKNNALTGETSIDAESIKNIFKKAAGSKDYGSTLNEDFDPMFIRPIEDLKTSFRNFRDRPKERDKDIGKYGTIFTRTETGDNEETSLEESKRLQYQNDLNRFINSDKMVKLKETDPDRYEVELNKFKTQYERKNKVKSFKKVVDTIKESIRSSKEEPILDENTRTMVSKKYDTATTKVKETMDIASNYVNRKEVIQPAVDESKEVVKEIVKKHIPPKVAYSVYKYIEKTPVDILATRPYTVLQPQASKEEVLTTLAMRADNGDQEAVIELYNIGKKEKETEESKKFKEEAKKQESVKAKAVKQQKDIEDKKLKEENKEQAKEERDKENLEKQGIKFDPSMGMSPEEVLRNPTAYINRALLKGAKGIITMPFKFWKSGLAKKLRAKERAFYINTFKGIGRGIKRGGKKIGGIFTGRPEESTDLKDKKGINPDIKLPGKEASESVGSKLKKGFNKFRNSYLSDDKASKKDLDNDKSLRRRNDWRTRLEESKKKEDTRVKEPKVLEKSKHDSLLDKLGSLFKPLLLMAPFVTGTLFKAIKGISGLIKPIMSGIGTIAKGVTSGFGWLMKWGKGLLGGLTKTLGSVLSPVIGGITSIGKSIGTKIAGLAANTTVGKMAIKGAKTIGTIAKKAIKPLGKVAKGLAKSSIAKKIIGVLKSFGSFIIKKLGPKAGAKMGAILSSKIASRGIPFLGWSLLLWDAGWIIKYMVDGMSLKSAISKQILGFDLFGEDQPVDENGNPIKPDEVKKDKKEESKNLTQDEARALSEKEVVAKEQVVKQTPKYYTNPDDINDEMERVKQNFITIDEAKLSPDIKAIIEKDPDYNTPAHKVKRKIRFQKGLHEIEEMIDVKGLRTSGMSKEGIKYYKLGLKRVIKAKIIKKLKEISPNSNPVIIKSKVDDYMVRFENNLNGVKFKEYIPSKQSKEKVTTRTKIQDLNKGLTYNNDVKATKSSNQGSYNIPDLTFLHNSANNANYAPNAGTYDEPEVETSIKGKEIVSIAKSAMDTLGWSPREQAMFLANVRHETGNFRWFKELGRNSYFNKYNGRKDLGNTEPGDGPRFKGRGLIHITGRKNYQEVGDLIGVDLVNNPELPYTDPNIAVSSSIGWWERQKKISPRFKNAIANNDIVTVNKGVNGGYNGMAERIKYYRQYSKEIADEGGVDVTSKPGDLMSLTTMLNKKREDGTLGTIQQGSEDTKEKKPASTTTETIVTKKEPVVPKVTSGSGISNTLPKIKEEVPQKPMHQQVAASDKGYDLSSLLTQLNKDYGVQNTQLTTQQQLLVVLQELRDLTKANVPTSPSTRIQDNRVPPTPIDTKTPITNKQLGETQATRGIRPEGHIHNARLVG